MSWLYSFISLFQPGVAIPAIMALKPMLIISAFALLLGVMRNSDYDRNQAFKNPAFIYLSLFVLINIISVYRGGLGEILKMFGSWYDNFVFMVIAVLLMSSVQNLYRFVWGFMIAALYIVGYGIFVAFYELSETVGGKAAGAYGMYENHNDYSYLLVVVFPFFFLFYRNETNKFKKLFCLIGAIACVVGMFMSMSRGGILALLMELFLIIFLVLNKKARLPAFVLGVVLSMGAIGYQWALRDTHSSGTYTSEDAKSSRIELWKAGINIFTSHPIIGIGSYNFREYAKDYYDLSQDQKGKNAHNTYIEILANTGLLGFIAFAGYIKHMFSSLIRIPSVVGLDPRLLSIRLAILIAFPSLLFRAFTNAKTYEPSFFTLCAITVVLSVLLKSAVNKASAQTAQNDDGADQCNMPEQTEKARLSSSLRRM